MPVLPKPRLDSEMLVPAAALDPAEMADATGPLPEAGISDVPDWPDPAELPCGPAPHGDNAAAAADVSA